MVHGWDGCRVGPHRILVDAGRRLGALGFAVLRFDLGGRGESEGDPLATDLDAMVADASAAVDALKLRLGERGRLGILGMCSGGNVALAAASLRDDVQAVVAWSTYPFQEQRSAAQDVSRTRHFAGDYMRKAVRLETWARLAKGRINLRAVRAALFGHYEAGEGTRRDLKRSRRDVLGAIRSYRGRMLFVFGSKDPEAAEAEKVFRSFCLENRLSADFASIDGANHNFQSAAWKVRAIESSASWLADALAPRGSPGFAV